MEQKNSPDEVKTEADKADATKKPEAKNKSSNRGLIVCCCLGAFVFFIILIIIGLFIYRTFSTSDFSTYVPTPNSTTNTNNNSTPTNNSRSTATYPVPNNCNVISPGSPAPLTITADGSGLNTNVNNIFYQIYGYTQADLRNQMAECGPKSDGENYDGITFYYFNWIYNYAEASNSCNIKDVAVGVNVNIYLPKWDTPDQYQNGLQDKWNDFSSALSTHENDHRDIAYEAGQEIVNTLSNLENASSCDAINTTVNDKANEVISVYDTKQKDFDAQTNHGATQGAQFP